MVVGDMPIHTFETPADAVATAKQFIGAGAQAVKLEGGVSHAAHIEAIRPKTSSLEYIRSASFMGGTVLVPLVGDEAAGQRVRPRHRRLQGEELRAA